MMMMMMMIIVIFVRNDGCGLEVGKVQERFTNHERQEVILKQDLELEDKMKLEFNSCSVKTFHFFLDQD